MFSRMDALDLWTPLPRLSAALALIWHEHTGYVVTHTERLLHLHEQTLHADLLVLVGTRGREGTTRTETGLACVAVALSGLPECRERAKDSGLSYLCEAISDEVWAF